MFGKIKALLEIIRLQVVAGGVTGVFIGGIVSGFQYDLLSLFLAMIAIFLVTAGSMALNDYFDWKIDAMVHPKRPIPSGRLSPKDGLSFALISFFTALCLAFFINILCFYIAIISIGLIILYEIFLKNQGIAGNMLVAFVCSMAFMFGAASVGQFSNVLLLAVMMFFPVIGREILMDIRDMDGDILARATLPIKIGKKSAVYLSCMFLSILVLLTPLPIIWNILGIWYLIVFVFVDILVIYAIILSLRDVNNVGKAADIIKLTIAVVLVGFIVGIVF